MVWSEIRNKKEKTIQQVYGLKKDDRKKEVYAYCPDKKCEFHEELPTYTCDEDLYEKTFFFNCNN